MGGQLRCGPLLSSFRGAKRRELQRLGNSRPPWELDLYYCVQSSDQLEERGGGGFKGSLAWGGRRSTTVITGGLGWTTAVPLLLLRGEGRGAGEMRATDTWKGFSLGTNSANLRRFSSALTISDRGENREGGRRVWIVAAKQLFQG